MDVDALLKAVSEICFAAKKEFVEKFGKTPSGYENAQLGAKNDFADQIIHTMSEYIQEDEDKDKPS